ncbi:MAG TPA: AMP-binding protein, partial [Acidimicrobiales bacterium]|nr:AMP-binding protein [Acidimicrobiales bacterium]
MPGPFNAGDWLVDRHVAAGGGARIAYKCEDRSQTYEELQRATWAAANGLRAVGVSPGDRILMLVTDEEAFPAAFLGGLRLGAVPIPVSTMLRPPEVATLAADSEATAIVVSGRYAGYLTDVAAAAPTMRAAVVVGPGAEPAEPPGVKLYFWSQFDDCTEPAGHPTTADTPGFWLYTSGTTG